jgi:hypothetical protein
MRFITLEKPNGNKIIIIATSILGIEEHRLGSVIYFNGGSTVVTEKTGRIFSLVMNWEDEE